jgi:hypothetical protein
LFYRRNQISENKSRGLITMFKKLNAKKTILILALFVIILLLLSHNVTAADGLILSATEEAGPVGGQVTVHINAENAAGTEGGQFLLHFDPNLVKPVSAEPGPLITAVDNNIYMANLEYAPGQLMLMWVTVTADTADAGTLCSFTFELLSDGVARLDFEEVIIVPDEIGLALASPGKIAVGTAVTDSDQDESMPDPDGVLADEEQGDAEADSAGVNPVLILGLVAVAVLLTVAALVFRKPKKKTKKK